MPLLSLYYHAKPFIPGRVRLGLRRILAKRALKNAAGTWPISESAARPPNGWCGWPAGKRFAFVIMHDVEGPTGLKKCRQVMDLEESLGFRSCFNFVPEGSYQVSPDLRREVVERGCEVGVHDLHHDGKLYSSRGAFAKKAVRINQYLRRWEAVGFRSAFMLNNLEWLHALDIAYDASTFDTDPFEPQPEGRNTIFPFWVSRSKSQDARPLSDSASPELQSLSGYVELPYTLAQDSTLFCVLNQPGPDIWKHKLRWVAKHGGMAMIGVHPDYLSFEKGTRGAFTFPQEHYREFLLWLRHEYEGAFWNATPREIAEHHLQAIKGKVCNGVARLTLMASMLSPLITDVSQCFA